MKVVMQNQSPILIHNILISIIEILEVPNKHQSKLYEILRNFNDEHNFSSVLFEYYSNICIVPIFITK